MRTRWRGRSHIVTAQGHHASFLSIMRPKDWPGVSPSNPRNSGARRRIGCGTHASHELSAGANWRRFGNLRHALLGATAIYLHKAGLNADCAGTSMANEGAPFRAQPAAVVRVVALREDDFLGFALSTCSRVSSASRFSSKYSWPS